MNEDRAVEKARRLALSYGYGPKAFLDHVRTHKSRPLSPARAAEFRGRRLKKMFGDKKARAERFARLCALYGYNRAVELSRETLVPVSAKTMAAFEAALGQ